jgi:hypothetical protein
MLSWSVDARAAGEPVAATGYFVDCANGNDNSTGTTPQSPWRTLGKVNSTVNSSGADVWLLAGTTCDLQTLTVDWAGTANDRVVIGTYYVSGGVAYQDIPTSAPLTNPQDGLVYGNGARAILRGSYQQACRTWPNICALHIPGLLNTGGVGAVTVPANNYAGMVEVFARYVTVQDIDIRDTAGMGLAVGPSSAKCLLTNPNCAYYTLIQRVKLDHTEDTAIKIQGVRNIVVRESEMGFTNIARFDGHTPYGAGTGAANTILWCNPCYALIENNYIHDTAGEGFGFYSASHVLARGNRSSNQFKVHYYFEGALDIVGEQNITAISALSHETGLGRPSSDSAKAGRIGHSIIFALEPVGAGQIIPDSGRRYIWRNNFASGVGRCFDAGLAQDSGRTLSGAFVGNTCVTDNDTILSFVNTPNGWVAPEGMQIQNNIIAQYPSGPVGGQTGSPAIVCNNNVWATTTPTGMSGTGDVVTTLTGIGFGAYAFDASSHTAFPAYTQFVIPGGSTANGAPALTDVYLTESDWTWVLAQRQWLAPCQTAQVPSATFVMRLATDYCGKARSTDSSMGALDAGGSVPDFSLAVE